MRLKDSEPILGTICNFKYKIRRFPHVVTALSCPFHRQVRHYALIFGLPSPPATCSTPSHRVDPTPGGATQICIAPHREGRRENPKSIRKVIPIRITGISFKHTAGTIFRRALVTNHHGICTPSPPPPGPPGVEDC